MGTEKAARGKLPTDTWWMTIAPTKSRERTDYPAKKLGRRFLLIDNNPTAIEIAEQRLAEVTVTEPALSVADELA